MRIFSFFVLFLLSSLSFTQTLPITPSIVTFHIDSTALICNNSDSIALDVDYDQTIDVVIRRSNSNDTCSPVSGSPTAFRHKQLTYNTYDTTAMLSFRNFNLGLEFAEEFFPGGTVTPANHFPSNYGFFFFNSMRQNSPSTCINLNGGYTNQSPYRYHFILEKLISGTTYHFLFALEFSSNNECFRLLPPLTVGVSEIEPSQKIKAYFSRDILHIQPLTANKYQYAEVFDLKGKLVDNFRISSASLQHNVSGWKSGIYIIKLSAANSQEVLVYKMIKP